MPMSLVSATVLRVRPAGVTVDFCPVCRRERRFRLAVAERRRVVLLVDRGPVGQAHHELACRSCGCVMERAASERPIGRPPTGAAAETFEPACLPIVRQRIEDCTRMEAARAAGRLKPEGREEMIRHAVHCFARLYDEGPTDRVTPVASALVFALTAALGYGAVAAWTRLERPLWAAACLAGIAAVWGVLWLWVETRSPRRKVRTWLARALAPLDPSEAEIRQARRELQSVRMGAGFKMRPAKLRAKIERIRRAGS